MTTHVLKSSIRSCTQAEGSGAIPADLMSDAIKAQLVLGHTTLTKGLKQLEVQQLLEKAKTTPTDHTVRKEPRS